MPRTATVAHLEDALDRHGCTPTYQGTFQWRRVYFLGAVFRHFLGGKTLLSFVRFWRKHHAIFIPSAAACHRSRTTSPEGLSFPDRLSHMSILVPPSSLSSKSDVSDVRFEIGRAASPGSSFPPIFPTFFWHQTSDLESDIENLGLRHPRKKERKGRRKKEGTVPLNPT